jgi:hypothetical protein
VDLFAKISRKGAKAQRRKVFVRQIFPKPDISAQKNLESKTLIPQTTTLRPLRPSRLCEISWEKFLCAFFGENDSDQPTTRFIREGFSQRRKGAKFSSDKFSLNQIYQLKKILKEYR